MQGTWRWDAAMSHVPDDLLQYSVQAQSSPRQRDLFTQYTLIGIMHACGLHIMVKPQDLLTFLWKLPGEFLRQMRDE